ncbi:MAG: efflux RND transporter permease subunit [Desulfovibrionaceae bacterium]|jgi:multidrug efflux pump subunit AcrB|nr:efflux RND transporter permease subunit [Desulfovibrionaceae bacterium]
MAGNLSAWAIRHKSLVIYCMLMSVVAGAYSYLNLGRNEDPTFTIKTMVVQTYWPGATQDETMLQVTDRIEKKLQETPYLDDLKSYTTAGESTVFVTLRNVIPKAEVKDVWYQVRKKVGDIRHTLPQDIEGPFFDDEFDDTYGIIYGFTADGFTHRELRDYVEKARTRLLRVPDVSKIEVLGAQDERIYVEFSTRRLAELGLDRAALLKAIAAQNAVAPSGTIQTEGESILVRVSGKIRSEKDLRAINFAVGGVMLRLSDIATIRRGYADPPQPLFRVNGKNALGLAIAMRSDGDVLALEKNLAAAVQRIKADLPVGIEATLVANQPKVVREAVHGFMKALWEAVAIVLGISFISLGLRAGWVVALSIPLVLATVFVAMDVASIALQRVSLGALIIALGLLVDDAMITIESMITKLEEGWEKPRAASFAYTSTAFPMLTGTVVTMLGFVPIGFARSSAGEYTFSLFAVVSIALLISWIVAVVFSPLLGTMILGSKIKKGRATSGRVMAAFRGLLLFSMRHAKTTILATLALFGLALALTPLVPKQFFPSSDRPELMVDLRLRQNASIYATDKASQRLDALLRADPDIDHWSSYVGRGAIRFYLPLDVQLANDFFTETVIVAKSTEARERVRKRLEAALDTSFPEVDARVFPLELGPPVGWPVQYRVSGESPTTVREIANRVAQVMGASPDLQKVSFNWMEPTRRLRIRVDQDQARLLGLSSSDVATMLYAALSGITVTRVRDDIYLIDVVARAEDAERASLDTIRTLELPLANGRTVPLSELAAVDYGQALPLVWRRDRLPTLTVQADVVGAVMPDTAVEHLRPKMERLRRELPPGYRIADGGSVEESAKSEASVVAVFPIMLILMLTVLMIQLQSFHHLFLVCSVAPLGLVGVVLALLATHQPMGFVALLGVVALIGMIIRNSVILVHQIEVEKNAGKSPWDAVVAATLLRFRPIMLTAMAAILGMLPIAPTVFWGPMANAIMGGLAGATLLTLLFLPSLYVTWFRIREPAAPHAAP